MTDSVYDIAVVGSGFAGTIMAMIAHRLGLRVVLLEKASHPRVVIGESSTPLSNILLETIADSYDLPALRPLSKWGTWQEAYPGAACGLKRGFTFFRHDLDGSHADTLDPRCHLLVGASPNDTIADTHWFRADFDRLLVEQAQSVGVRYLEKCGPIQLTREEQGWSIRTAHPESIQAGFLFDATGPRGFLHNALQLSECDLPRYPATSALYTHFSGVDEFASHAGLGVDAAPYAPDDAALHHVFPGGWIWVLRFNNGWTSAGIAATETLASDLCLREGESAWQRLLARLPAVQRQFRHALPVREFKHMPRLSYRAAQTVGDGWAMLPSAAGFVDPLLSTGFPLTLLGVLRLGKILETSWNPEQRGEALATYAAVTDRELLATSRLVAALYANMGRFETFRRLSLLYFAAASYAETARRLGKPELASSFLLCDHPVFGPGTQRIAARATQSLDDRQREELHGSIDEFVADFNVAGLHRHPRNGQYPVLAEDLFAGAHLLGATRQEIQSLLTRSGFYANDRAC